MNWLLCVVVLVIGGCTYAGYRKGLIMTVFSIVSVIITLILASILTPVIGNSIRNNEKIYSEINKKVLEVVNSDKLEAKTDEAQIQAIDSLALPDSIKVLLKNNNNPEVYQQRAIDSFKDYIADYLTRIIINAIVYICVYIVIRILVFFIAKALDVISKLPIISNFNVAGGTICGFVEGLLIVWLVFVLVTMMAGNQFGQSAMQCVNDSLFLSVLYDNNLILKAVTGFIK